MMFKVPSKTMINKNPADFFIYFRAFYGTSEIYGEHDVAVHYWTCVLSHDRYDKPDMLSAYMACVVHAFVIYQIQTFALWKRSNAVQ